MNDKRRGRLRYALEILSSAGAIVESVCDDEQDSMENCPENLQGTERFERMEDAVDSLNEAIEKIDNAKDHIRSAIN